MIKPFIARNIYEPLYSNFYRKDNRLAYYKFYKRVQWNTLDENKRIQAQRLCEIIKYASENIPYYRRIINNNKIPLSENTIFKNIKKIPILTKDIIKKEFNNLYKIQEGVKWNYNTSGGSTGEPAKFVQDYNYGAHSIAMVRLQDEWAGCLMGDTVIELWGSERELLKEKQHIKNRFSRWIKSIYSLNAFLMDEQKMKAYVHTINKKRPKMILAYAQSIHELAKFIEANSIKAYSPCSIITSAGVLYPPFRKTIERVFKCPVFNRYGSRETYSIACECEKHEGLHVSIFTHYIEILDSELEPCLEGETGEIYVTLLTNFTMPLIRYKIGDQAVYTERNCSCGRGLPLIKNIVGRSGCMIRTRKTVIDSTALTTSFYYFDSIKKYQFIQKEIDYILIKIVIDNLSLWQKDKGRLNSKLKKILGKDVTIVFDLVEDIKPSASGKYQYFLGELH